MRIEKQLGMRIRYLRKQKALTIEELSLEAEINPSYLSDLERGTRNPTLKVMSKLAVALGITLSELTKGLEVY